MSHRNTQLEYEDWDIILEPNRDEKNYLKDFLRFKDLFYILTWRDIKVKYKQTLLGVLWLLIKPLLSSLIFTFVFSRIAHLKTSGNYPYFIMVLTGMLPWQFFSSAINESTSSLISNTSLITKVYFPRMIIPASAIMTCFVDFMISFVLLLLIMLMFGVFPDPMIFFLPIFILLLLCFVFGCGLLLTSLNVNYRDFRYIIPFILQFGLYVSPVGFDTNVIGSQWQIWFSLNPMTGIINGFRWCLLGEQLNLNAVLISCVTIAVVFTIGWRHFRKTEKSFADII